MHKDTKKHKAPVRLSDIEAEEIAAGSLPAPKPVLFHGRPLDEFDAAEVAENTTVKTVTLYLFAKGMIVGAVPATSREEANQFRADFYAAKGAK